MEQQHDIQSDFSDFDASQLSTTQRTGRSAAQHVEEERAVCIDLPNSLPILREEIALLRAYLTDEINALLFDEG